MIFESEKMRLNCIRVVRQNEINDIYICKDMNQIGSSNYTVLAVKDHDVAKEYLRIFQKMKMESYATYMDCFSTGGIFYMVFPYKQERYLEEFYRGDSLSLVQCEEVCINLILACISAGLPYPIVYLILKQKQIHMSKDHSIYFGYQLDLKELDWSKKERDCVVECASILLQLLEPKASLKATSYLLLQKKVEKRSYHKFTELYKDIRIAAAPQEKKGLIKKLKAWYRRNRDSLFGILVWICGILAVLVVLSFITQVLFGDIPWLRLFFNGFKVIGTESLLQ